MINEAIQEYGATLDRAFAHDRTKSVGASEIGLCARKTHWAKKGGPKDSDEPQNWGAHVRGTMIETHFWLPAMHAKFGPSLVMAGKDQKTLEKGFLSATPDGVISNAAGDIVVECKTIDPRVNLTKERESNHFQVQVQMGLVRELTDYNPEKAIISYIDASFWSEVDEYVVAYDQGIYEAAQVRAEKIMTATDAKDLEPEGWIAGGSECEYCPFTKACGIIRRSVPEREAAADSQFVAEIADMCRDVQDAQDQIKILDVEVRQGQQKIKDRLREKSVRRIPKVVVWSTVKGRDNYDMKGIKSAATAAGVDVQAFCTAGEPTDRLQILVGNISTG